MNCAGDGEMERQSREGNAGHSLNMEHPSGLRDSQILTRVKSAAAVKLIQFEEAPDLACLMTLGLTFAFSLAVITAPSQMSEKRQLEVAAARHTAINDTKGAEVVE